MSAGGIATESEVISMPSEDELQRRVDTFSHWRIRNLNVDCRGERVKITGISSTYYSKQLATQAVLSAHPDVQIDNEILVFAC
jgi:hypothetical protein